MGKVGGEGEEMDGGDERWEKEKEKREKEKGGRRLLNVFPCTYLPDFLQGVPHFTNLWWGAPLHCAEAGLKGISDSRALLCSSSGHTGKGLLAWDGLLGRVMGG